jgi:chorismate mutase-like protein
VRILPLIAVFLISSGPLDSQSFQWDQAAAIARPEEQLVNSVIARLLLSREVAWSKYSNHAKVRDLAREAAVLTALKREGAGIGLSPEEVLLLFKPQIVASCRLQEELMSGWASGLPRPANPPKDLKKDLRPLLDKVDATLLLQWKAVGARSFDLADFHAARRAIQEAGFSRDVANAAARPFAPRSSPAP